MCANGPLPERGPDARPPERSVDRAVERIHGVTARHRFVDPGRPPELEHRVVEHREPERSTRDTHRAVDDQVIVGSPLGCLRIEVSADAVVAIRFLDHGSPGPQPTSGLSAEAASQLSAYFAGRLRRFDLPVAPAGTPFQRQIWTALLEIPYGVTWTYGQMAAAVGRPKSSRAVGAANAANPIPVVLPCHRVIGADGGLTGYGGGIERKRALLDLEGVRRPGPGGTIVPLQMNLF